MLEYVDRVNKVTDSELLEDLKRVAEIVNSTSLTIAEYKMHGTFDPTTIIRHFESWNNALKLAGLQISNRQYTLLEMYDNLAEIWLKIGRQPSRRDLLRMQSPISYKAYERRFGKWSLALKSFVEYYNSNANLEMGLTTQSSIISAHQTTRDINLRMRFRVMSRDNFKCCYCGASPAKDPSVQLHIDHKTPWAKGGETTMENLQTLCSKCNLGKSDLLVTQETTASGNPDVST